MEATSWSPSASTLVFLGDLVAGATGVGGAEAVGRAAPAPFNAAPWAFVFVRFGGEPSVPSATARREPFRAGRAAGTMSAGRSARVRGATIARKV